MRVQHVLESPKFKAAQAYIERDHDRMVGDIIRLTEIQAPSFKEERRARAYLEMLRQHGLASVEIDAEGNVMGIRKGSRGDPMLTVAAHLDTVFPEAAEIKVKREGTRLMAPGVGDNARGLAVLLALIRALDEARIQTTRDILFVGNVGEEGRGDLRGVRYLFQQGPYRQKIGMFVSIDGTGNEGITNGALGSKRFRIAFKGPGGHSYGAFGLVNPAFALGNAMAKFAKMRTPKTPKTTFNVGIVGGGTSVNSIPSESWMEIDLRSESPRQLNQLVEKSLAIMRQAAEEENRVRSTLEGKIELDIQLIGDRPSGETPAGAPMVRLAGASLKAHGIQPVYRIGSTDANIPIGMGIPAITIGSGGKGGRGHSPDEWIDVEKATSVKGIQVVLTILLSLAGLE
ncbi:MAG: M20/M25/M40 family metallo-hydrolase [Acidobacteria bacterium]|nr:M20/M25/M40 family metallo-hydrolase [Acidobacteriota bacterium]